jgi:uncharacterized C2H2 Zn-finger protein
MIVLVIAYTYYEIHYFKCFRCGKIFPRKKGYRLIRNKGWFCEECYKITNKITEGLMFVKNGALKHLKKDDGNVDPRTLLLILIGLVILTAWICWNYIINVILH